MTSNLVGVAHIGMSARSVSVLAVTKSVHGLRSIVVALVGNEQLAVFHARRRFSTLFVTTLTALCSTGVSRPPVRSWSRAFPSRSFRAKKIIPFDVIVAPTPSPLHRYGVGSGPGRRSGGRIRARVAWSSPRRRRIPVLSQRDRRPAVKHGVASVQRESVAVGWYVRKRRVESGIRIAVGCSDHRLHRVCAVGELVRGLAGGCAAGL